MAADAVPTNKWSDRSTSTLSAVLLVAICYMVVRILFFLLDDQVAAKPPVIVVPKTTASATQASNGSQIDPSSIPLWNLFGKEGVKEVAAIEKEVVAPKTNLQLQLEGVFVASSEDRSTAIIAEMRKEGQLYHIGDKVPGNVSLAAVHPDRVLLNRGGKLEALYFADQDSKGFLPGTRKVETPKVDPRNSARTGRRLPGVPGGQINKMISGTTMPSSSDIAEVLREELGADAAGALAELGLVQNNGRGYKVSEAGSPIFSALGAKPGYIITDVNGFPLGDPQTDMSRIEEVIGSGTLKVTMEDPNGRIFTQELATDAF